MSYFLYYEDAIYVVPRKLSIISWPIFGATQLDLIQINLDKRGNGRDMGLIPFHRAEGVLQMVCQK